jgi:hypothetical protein
VKSPPVQAHQHHRIHVGQRRHQFVQSSQPGRVGHPEHHPQDDLQGHPLHAVLSAERPAGRPLSHLALDQLVDHRLVAAKGGVGERGRRQLTGTGVVVAVLHQHGLITHEWRDDLITLAGVPFGWGTGKHLLYMGRIADYQRAARSQAATVTVARFQRCGDAPEHPVQPWPVPQEKHGARQAWDWKPLGRLPCRK